MEVVRVDGGVLGYGRVFAFKELVPFDGHEAGIVGPAERKGCAHGGSAHAGDRA